MKVLTNRSKHFMMVEVSAPAIWGLPERDNDGLLEACGDYRQEQQEVKRVCEDLPWILQVGRGPGPSVRPQSGSCSQSVHRRCSVHLGEMLRTGFPFVVCNSS